MPAMYGPRLIGLDLAQECDCQRSLVLVLCSAIRTYTQSVASPHCFLGRSLTRLLGFCLGPLGSILGILSRGPLLCRSLTRLLGFCLSLLGFCLGLLGFCLGPFSSILGILGCSPLMRRSLTRLLGPGPLLQRPSTEHDHGNGARHGRRQ